MTQVALPGCHGAMAGLEHGNSWARQGHIPGSDYEMGGVYYETTIAHEIGHALGLSHPFDGGYNNIGNINDSLDNSYTIMTYDQQPDMFGINPMPVDILAMEFLYGGSNDANLGNTNHWLDPLLFDTSSQQSNHMYLVNDARMSHCRS